MAPTLLQPKKSLVQSAVQIPVSAAFALQALLLSESVTSARLMSQNRRHHSSRLHFCVWIILQILWALSFISALLLTEYESEGDAND